MLIPLLIIQALFFTALIFLLRFIFSRNLNSALTRLNVLHEENLVKESQLNEELKLAQQEREAEVRRGKEEATVIVEEAKQEAVRLRLKLEEDARSQAEKIIVQAKAEVDDLKEKLIRQAQGQSLELALSLIEQTFTQQNKEILQHQFITEIIAEISKVAPESFTVVADRARIISSYPLQEAQRKALKKNLEEKLNREIILEEVIDKNLIIGLVVEMSGLVIEGTLRNRLYKAIPGLKNS
jgi:F-type H+-transporting ATPase subunit b